MLNQIRRHSSKVPSPMAVKATEERASALWLAFVLFGVTASGVTLSGVVKRSVAALPKLQSVSVRSHGSLAFTTESNGAQQCLPSGQCGHVGFLTGTLTGDVTGEQLAIESVVATPSLAFLGGNSLITGTVKGCGTGTFAIATAATWVDKTHPAKATAVPVRFEVLRGLGTGGLTTLEGEGVIVTLPKTGPNLDYELAGTMRCHATNLAVPSS